MAKKKKKGLNESLPKQQVDNSQVDDTGEGPAFNPYAGTESKGSGKEPNNIRKAKQDYIASGAEEKRKAKLEKKKSEYNPDNDPTGEGPNADPYKNANLASGKGKGILGAMNQDEEMVEPDYSTPKSESDTWAVQKQTSYSIPPQKKQDGIVNPTDPQYVERAVAPELAKNMQNMSTASMAEDPSNRVGNDFFVPQEEYKKAFEADKEVNTSIDETSKAKSDILKNGLNVNQEADPADPSTNLTVDQVAAETAKLADDVIKGNRSLQDVEKELKRIASAPVRHTEPAIEHLGLQQYYPEINRPLQVGAYSGSIVGSNPIFTGGAGYFPMGIVDARKRAFERVKKEKIQKQKEIKRLATNLAQGALPYQDQLNEESFNIIRKYEELTGGDWSKLETDPSLMTDFMSELASLKVLGDKTLYVEGKFKELAKERATGKRYVPKKIEEYENKFWTAKGGIESFKNNDWLFDSERYIRSYDQWTGDLDNSIKTILSGGNGLDEGLWNIKEGVDTNELMDAYAKLDRDNYDEVYTFYAKYFDQTRLQGIIQGAVDQNDYYMGDTDKEIKETLDSMGAYLMSHMPIQVDWDKNVIQHNEKKAAQQRAFQRWSKQQDLITTEYANYYNAFTEGKGSFVNNVKEGNMGQAIIDFQSSTGSIYDPQTGKFNSSLSKPLTEQTSADFVGWTDANGNALTAADIIAKGNSADATPEEKQWANYLSSNPSVNVTYSRRESYPVVMDQQGNKINLSLTNSSNPSTYAGNYNAENMQLGYTLKGSLATPKAGKTEDGKYIIEGQEFDNLFSAQAYTKNTYKDPLVAQLVMNQIVNDEPVGSVLPDLYTPSKEYIGSQAGDIMQLDYGAGAGTAPKNLMKTGDNYYQTNQVSPENAVVEGEGYIDLNDASIYQ